MRLAIVSLVVAHAWAQQTILQPHSAPPVGEVRQYLVNRHIRQLVREQDLDVWHLNSTHIHIYFPPSTIPSIASLPLPEPLNSFVPYSPPPIPPSPTPIWDLTTLVNCTFHNNYHPVFEILEFMRAMEVKWPNLVTVRDIGHTAEDREMFVLEIKREDRKKKGKGKKVKKLGFVMQGAQHAREWVASATSLYLAHALLVDKKVQGSLYHLLDDFDFYIIPLPNPDGYEYTWSEDRFWYKNRQVLGSDADCRGLDMNRNWGYQWLPSSSNTKPDYCSHWYPGTRPFEAPEVNNLANYVRTRVKRKSAFLDLRSYGQMLSAPFSYSCDVLPSEAEDLLEAAAGAAAALHKVHGTQTATGSLCEMLYSAPGNVVDWMYSVAGIKYSYAAHLRDTGTYGYALPEWNIRPTGEETAKMLEYLAKFVKMHQPKRKFDGLEVEGWDRSFPKDW